MMDHNSVIENQIVERYLLGELTDAERDDYEEHYFECPICAEDVRCGSEFMMYAPEVAREFETSTDGGQQKTPPVIPIRMAWIRPVAMAAGGILAVGLAVGGYKSVVVHRAMRDKVSAQIVAASVVLNPSRSIEESVLPANKVSRLRFVIPPGSYKAYRAVIVDTTSKKEWFPRDIKAEEANSAVEWVLTAGALDPGDYAVVVDGVMDDSTLDKGNELRLPFRLEIQK